MYLDTINKFLDTYAPLKKLMNTSWKLKFKPKFWITLGLQKPISAKNKLLVNLINKKYFNYNKFTLHPYEEK